MQILVYTVAYAPAWGQGGVAVATTQLCEGLAALGHKVVVMTTSIGFSEGVLAETIVFRNGVRVHYYPYHLSPIGILSEGLAENAAAHLQTSDVALVAGVWQPTTRPMRLAAQRTRIPYITIPHGALGAYSWGAKRWKKWPYFLLVEWWNNRAAKGVCFTSEMEASDSKGFGLPRLAAVIPNAVGFEDMVPNQKRAAALRKELDIEPGTVLFLYAGRLHHKKGLELLPRVFLRLSNLKWAFLAVGTDSDGSGEELKDEFAAWGLSKRVHFKDTAERGQLADIYAAADALLLPSLHENFGNVVIEALAAGCAVFGSRHVGVMSLVADLPNVRALERREDDWVEALRLWISSYSPWGGLRQPDPKLRLRFGREKIAMQMSLFIEKVVTT